MQHKENMDQSSGSTRDVLRGEWISFADFRWGVREGNAKDARGQEGGNVFECTGREPTGEAGSQAAPNRLL